MNVIIVGNGSSVLNKKNGDVIDGFEEVIRLNDYETESYEEHSGSKTTIWSTGAGSATVPRNTEQYKEVWVSCPSICINMMSGLADRVTKGSSFTIMGYNFLKGMEEKLNFPPNTYCTSGIYAVGFAIQRFNHIYITGFDFFRDCRINGNTNHYYGEHKTEKVGKDHRMDLEEIYINKMVEENKITVL